MVEIVKSCQTAFAPCRPASLRGGEYLAASCIRWQAQDARRAIGASFDETDPGGAGWAIAKKNGYRIRKVYLSTQAPR
jgi:hypothetical protein